MDKSSFGQGAKPIVTPTPDINPELSFTPLTAAQAAHACAALGRNGPSGDPSPIVPSPIDVLRRIQWFGLDDDGWDCCPLCERRSVQGHKDFCDIDVVLRAHPPTTLAPAPPRG